MKETFSQAKKQFICIVLCKQKGQTEDFEIFGLSFCFQEPILNSPFSILNSN